MMADTDLNKIIKFPNSEGDIPHEQRIVISLDVADQRFLLLFSGAVIQWQLALFFARILRYSFVNHVSILLGCSEAPRFH